MESLETHENTMEAPLNYRAVIPVVALVVFVVLVLENETRQFALPVGEVYSRRKRIRCLYSVLKNYMNQCTRTALLTAARRFEPEKNNLVVVYTTLPGVQGRVNEFLTGKSMSGPRDYDTDPWGFECSGAKSNAKWSQHLFTLAVINALLEVDVAVPDIDQYRTKFYSLIGCGILKGHVQDLLNIVRNVPSYSHDYQRQFLVVMDGVPPFNSSGFDTSMTALVEKLRNRAEFKNGLEQLIKVKAERLMKRAAVRLKRAAARLMKRAAARAEPAYIAKMDAWNAILLEKVSKKAAKAAKTAAKAAKTAAKAAAKAAVP